MIYRYPDGPSTPTKREYERALRLADQLYQFVLSLIPREAHPKQQ